jgi:hypothetical protein
MAFCSLGITKINFYTILSPVNAARTSANASVSPPNVSRASRNISLSPRNVARASRNVSLSPPNVRRASRNASLSPRNVRRASQNVSLSPPNGSRTSPSQKKDARLLAVLSYNQTIKCLKTYQMIHIFSRTIASPVLQPNAFENCCMFDIGPFTRQRAAECGSVKTC